MLKQFLTRPTEIKKLKRKLFLFLLIAIIVNFGIFDLIPHFGENKINLPSSSSKVSFEQTFPKQNFSLNLTTLNNKKVTNNTFDFDKFRNRNIKGYSIKRPCENIILKDFTDKDSDLNENIFFLETSGKTGFDGRQTCALESAIIYSGFRPKVLMTTKFINMQLRPSMCNMVKRHYPDKIGFYGVDLDYLFSNTPLDGIQREISRAWMSVHLSDLMRQALIYKFGGYYADLDVITIRSLRGVENVYPFDNFYPIENATSNCALPKDAKVKNVLNNGIFHFKAGNEFVWQTMLEIRRVYKDMVDHRNGVGPGLVGRVAKSFLNSSDLTVIQTKELSLLPPFVFIQPAFHPYWFVFTNQDRNTSFWNKMLRCSKAVHIFHSIVKDEEVTGNAKRELFSYLGPRYCPASFVHLKQF